LAAGELRKGGTKIKIQELPLRVLAVLLERPGEVVTREELREKLWAEDEFVEFEHSLNTAVNKLRSALGDQADQPRYIETIPKRGYRFVGSVAGHRQTSQPAQTTPRLKHFVLGAAMVAATAGITWWITRPEPPEPSPRLVQLTTDPGLSFQPTVSGDGTLMAYASDRGGSNLDLWIKQLPDGEPH
ncbi:MAG: hypothetical protein GY953_26005, partial [bacterium]|nr:hypothetical protein [bacterium]